MIKSTLLGALAIALAVTTAAQATPAGKNGLILYLHVAGGHSQIFSARSDGSHVEQLTHLADSDAADASWSRDGKRIAFARDFDLGKPTEHLDLYTMNADGSDAHAFGLKGLNGGPVWFPDGKRLLFAHVGGLWIVPAAGGAPKRVLHIVGDFEGQTLSPNGRQVAYIRNKGNRSALYTADVATGKTTQVTPWSLGAKPKLDWSPDGTTLLSRNDSSVYTVDGDGSGPTTLVKGSDLCSESFSPDGTKVLYIDHCSTGGDKSRLWIVGVDGAGARKVPRLLGHWVSWGVR